jgi:hypothetical protein
MQVDRHMHTPPLLVYRQKLDSFKQLGIAMLANMPQGLFVWQTDKIHALRPIT